MTLEVRLRHAFGGFSLDVAFEAPPGVTVLFGRSGSGKTTVINAVAGLLRPDAGRVSVDGRTLMDSERGLFLPPHRRRLGYIFQEGRLFPHMSVRRNLLYGRWFAPRGGRDEMGRVVEMLGIGHLLERRPGTLSGGEKQRVAIGRALLARPEIILADEPLAALDEARKAEILPYFERLRDEVSAPILYVSHSAAEVARLATTVIALQDGRVAGQGPAAEVLGGAVFGPPAGAREAGSMLTGRVARHHSDGLSEVTLSAASLLLPRIEASEGARVRLWIAAHDVMIALDRPERISALNAIPAEVVSVLPGEGPGALVNLAAGGDRIVARITKRSAAALELAPGVRCHALIKSVAIAPRSVGAEGL